MCSNSKRMGQWVAIAVAIGLVCSSAALAKKPPKPDPEEPSGGYTIVSLPSPDGVTSHYSVLESISDLGPAGEVHVVGYQYHSPTDIERAYGWTRDAAGNVEIEDLSPWFWYHDLDVNSAGIICGRTNSEPGNRASAVLFPDGTFVVLPVDLPDEYSSVRLNNPDDSGDFQVVGRYFMWDIASDGEVLPKRLVAADGTQLYAYDVNDHEEIAGFIFMDNDRIPAIGRIVDGELQISTRVNPNPDVIIGFRDFQIDNGGNVLGYGVEPASGAAYYARAVIWPASGGAIDLAAEQRLTGAHGNGILGSGIATVEGMMQVVGDAYATPGTFPYLYASGVLSDLDRLSEGDEPWEIQGVDDINHAGIICGIGVVGKQRHRYAANCLLIPTNR